MSVLGLVLTLRHREPLAGALAGVLVGTWVMHSILYPLPGPRYLLPAVPALLYFLYAGLTESARAIQAVWPHHQMTARAALLLCCVLVVGAQSGVPGPHSWDNLVRQLRRIATTDTVLVSGEEGGLVTEFAMQDPERHRRPSWRVLRGSKMLASSTWMGAGYRMRYESVFEVLAALENWHVSVVVLAKSHAPPPHMGLLREAMRQAGGAWIPQPSPLAGVELFVRKAPPKVARGVVEVDVTHTLGRKLIY
jgi:hypothetical protein